MPFTLTWAPASKPSGLMRCLGPLVLLTITVLAATTMSLGQGNTNRTATSRPIQSGTSLSPHGDRLPDSNDQMLMRQAQARQANFNAANAERLRELARASRMLETLAIALKAEVDKDQQGDASANEVQKAENIEKLAHLVIERMKLTIGPN